MTLPARRKFAGLPKSKPFPTRTQPSFQAQAEDTHNLHHGRTRQHERRYRSGEVVRQSGIYEVLHDREHRESHEVVMISGDRFPDCETCNDKVRFRLVRTAPYIFQDEDFEEES
jgi:hypothetical protein